MFYEKCRNCKYRCRCCASHFFDMGPNCSRCEGLYDEFWPAEHVKYCGLDGLEIERPVMDICGRIVHER